MCCHIAVMLYSVPTGSDAVGYEFLLLGDQESWENDNPFPNVWFFSTKLLVSLGSNKHHLLSLTYGLIGPTQVISFTRCRVHRVFQTLPCG